MRVLIGLVVAAAVAWGGYWFVGSHMFLRGVEDWFAAQGEAGREARAENLAVTGFPSRFDLNADNIEIRDPASGWGWRAPFAQVFMLSYKPNHVIFALPDDQVIETPMGEVALQSQGLRGSVRTTLSLQPVRAAMEGQALRATLSRGEVTASELRFGSRLTEGTTHEVALDLDSLGVIAPGISLTDGQARVRGLVTLAEVVSDLPDAVGVPVQSIDLTEGAITFAETSVSLSGQVHADAEGFAEGSLTLRVENWPAALRAAVEAGLVPESRAETLEGGFRMMAEGDAVELPLSLSGGLVRFGPLPLGPAPRLK